MEKWAVNLPLTWSLNEESLQEAIASFGKVDMEGVLLFPSGEESKCLPGRYVIIIIIISEITQLNLYKS